MPEVAVRIPQIGEGLQEARLVAVLKQPGEPVRRDEPIYQMETDKAVMDVESPYEGRLVRWMAEVDTILPIGAEVARMEVAEGVGEVGGHAAAAPESSAPAQQQSAGILDSPSVTRRMDVPPRTRAYAKEQGLTEQQLAEVPAAGSKLMPSDIDAFLSGRAGPATADQPAAAQAAQAFDEAPLGSKQRLLSSRLSRGAQLVVPGTISVACDWEAVEASRAKVKSSGDAFQPSAFTMFAFAVARALASHPGFRSTLSGDSILRTYRHAQLGIAVALPGDELVLAVVEDADTLDWRTFAERVRERIDEARGGRDQATEAVTVSLTNMQAFGLRDAVPVVAAPAVATLFLGEVYKGLDQTVDQPRLKRFVNLVLTFDHRLMNGVGAANFLNEVKRNVEAIGELIGQTG